LFSTNFPEISRSIEKKVEALCHLDGSLQCHAVWQKMFMQRFLAGKMVSREVDKMSKAFYHRQDLSKADMEHFVDLAIQVSILRISISAEKFSDKY
jgi:hypothetical protein